MTDENPNFEEVTGQVVAPPISIGPEGAGQFSPYVLDNYAAPELSKLTECGAPELPEPRSELGAFILKSLFIRTISDELRRALFLFGRRTFHAVQEYRIGRELLLAYVNKLPQTNSHFLQALEATTHFEQCLASAYQAATLGHATEKLAGASPFKDVLMQRVYKLWNRSKHFDEDLTNPRNPGWAAPEIIAPIWLTNYGVSSANGSLTFQELHSFVTELRTVFELIAKV